MQAMITILFILAIVFGWWLYEKHDSNDNNPPYVEYWVKSNDNQPISDFTKINIITIWILKGYYYFCIESYAALVLVISICGFQPQGDSLNLLRCSIFEIIDCFWVNNLLDSVQQSTNT